MCYNKKGTIIIFISFISLLEFQIIRVKALCKESICFIKHWFMIDGQHKGKGIICFHVCRLRNAWNCHSYGREKKMQFHCFCADMIIEFSLFIWKGFSKMASFSRSLFVSFISKVHWNKENYNKESWRVLRINIHFTLYKNKQPSNVLYHQITFQFLHPFHLKTLHVWHQILCDVTYINLLLADIIRTYRDTNFSFKNNVCPFVLYLEKRSFETLYHPSNKDNSFKIYVCLSCCWSLFWFVREKLSIASLIRINICSTECVHFKTRSSFHHRYIWKKTLNLQDHTVQI